MPPVSCFRARQVMQVSGVGNIPEADVFSPLVQHVLERSCADCRQVCHELGWWPRACARPEIARQVAGLLEVLVDLPARDPLRRHAERCPGCNVQWREFRAFYADINRRCDDSSFQERILRGGELQAREREHLGRCRACQLALEAVDS